jgi:hypothetical protein
MRTSLLKPEPRLGLWLRALLLVAALVWYFTR